MELNELRRIAEAATPGPWEAYDRGIGYEVHDASGYELNSGMRETFTESDATHIATFDPPTVLALLSRLEQAEQAVDDLRGKYDEAETARIDGDAQLDRVREVVGEDAPSFFTNEAMRAYDKAMSEITRALDGES